MIIEYQKKNILIKLFIIFSFCVCWLSISTSFNDLLILKNDQELNIKVVINFLRQASIYFCFFLSVILLLFSKKNFFQKKDLIYIFFSIYFLSQIPGLIYSENNFDNIYLIFSALTAILTIILFEKFFSIGEKKILIYLSFFILLIVFLMGFIPQLISFIKGSGDLGFYGNLKKDSELFLNKDSPRSSGLSRTSLLLIILLYLLENILFKKKLFFTKLLVIFLLSVILLYQSRTMIFISVIILTLIFLFENDFSFKNILKFSFIYFIVPILIFVFSLTYYSNQKYEHNVTNMIKNQNLSRSEILQKNIIKKKLLTRKVNDFSSGRFSDWKKIYNKFSIEHIFFGYGSQGDRYLINQNASNGLIYAFASSGIFGFIFFILFSLITLKKIPILTINFKQIDHENFFSSLIILTIFLRSLLENSYSLYSIDFMILITLICFIKNFKFKN
tara:strand:+ start:649 stop:1986 length:1338 start_codon:yes stop_codon:yes gene_type:complete